MQSTVESDRLSTSKSADALRDLETLRSGCGIYKLEQAQLSLTGSDRVRWLNGMVTNNVRDLAVGHGVYAFLLNPQGKIQADLYAFNRAESLVVDTESAQIETILQIFDKYIIMDDVNVENLTGKFVTIGVAGAKAARTLTDVGLTGQDLKPLEIRDVILHGKEVIVVRGDNPLVPNYELWLAPSSAEELWDGMRSGGAHEIGDNSLEVFRVLCGLPKVGQDIRQRDLPQETGQERALNFTKGCYIGQEIVERIRSRGAVHRTFVGFEVAGATPLPGAKVQGDGKDVGEITSVATIPTEDGHRTVALGYLRKEFVSSSTELAADEVKVRPTSLPFSDLIQEIVRGPSTI